MGLLFFMNRNKFLIKALIIKTAIFPRDSPGDESKLKQEEISEQELFPRRETLLVQNATQGIISKS